MKKTKVTETIMRIMNGTCGVSGRIRDGKEFSPEDRKRRLLAKKPELQDLHKRGLLYSHNDQGQPILTHDSK